MILCVEIENCDSSTCYFDQLLTYSRCGWTGETKSRPVMPNVCKSRSSREITQGKHSFEEWTRLVELLFSNYQRNKIEVLHVRWRFKLDENGSAHFAMWSITFSIITFVHYYHASWENARKGKHFSQKCFPKIDNVLII